MPSSAPMLETDRLTLRPPGIQGAQALLELTSNPAVMEFYPSCLDLAGVHKLLARIRRSFAAEGFGQWNLYFKKTHAFIGQAGIIHSTIALSFSPCIAISWRLLPKYWGHGYATEASHAVLHYAFNTLKLPEIVAWIIPINTASIRIANKLGMVRNPADDFDSPAFPPAHPYRKHQLYRIKNPAFSPTA